MLRLHRAKTEQWILPAVSPGINDFFLANFKASSRVCLWPSVIFTWWQWPQPKVSNLISLIPLPWRFAYFKIKLHHITINNIAYLAHIVCVFNQPFVTSRRLLKLVSYKKLKFKSQRFKNYWSKNLKLNKTFDFLFIWIYLRYPTISPALYDAGFNLCFYLLFKRRKALSLAITLGQNF